MSRSRLIHPPIGLSLYPSFSLVTLFFPKCASSLGHVVAFSISAQSSTGSSDFSFEAVSSFNAAALSASSVVAVASSSKTPVATTVAAPETTGTPVLVPSRAQVRDDPVTRAFSTAQFQISYGNLC
ncbi:hypothetical protein BDP27DRAFT_1429411 [Rhodocollybia butyracea]|uniref:Uncharacterized protein n=1 Tax=Rhodocollybia butyracea TaxID=206335 RepID=A0A9P5PE16_9AGAR|nr:hypothetical protein BDP27DRAFT_1429411 [Rhodocollybia butyracea]